MKEEKIAVDTPEVEIARLRFWLARFKEKMGPPTEEDPHGPIVETDLFVEKIERVLAGEETLGVAPCVVCGLSETVRSYSPAKLRWMDGKGGFLTSFGGVFCREFPCSAVQEESECQGCGTMRWVRYSHDDRGLLQYLDDKGILIERCLGCDVPLAKSFDDSRRIKQMIYEAAGYRFRERTQGEKR